MNRTLLVFIVLVISRSAAEADPFNVTDFSIEGSGGTSRGGTFVVTGVTGEPAAGVMTGGEFTLQGAWQPAPPESSFPLIGVQYDPAAGNLAISWPTTATGYLLQSNPDPGNPGGWTDIPTTPVVVGGNLEVVIQTELQLQFYRLRKPATP